MDDAAGSDAHGRDGPRRVSLKHVAARSGVSYQTVSKVLAGRGTVTDETRERIEAAAEALGYLPDEVARSLVRQRTRTLGVIVGDLSDHVVSRFVTGAEQEARRHAYALLIVNLATESSDGERSVRSLLGRRVDGIVTAAPQLEDDPRLGELLGQVPTVGIHSVHGLVLPQVGSDQRETGRVATDHLLGLGRRRVGMVTGLASRHVTHSRTRGWEDAHREHGVDVDQTWVEEADWTAAGGHAAALRLLGRVPDLDALFVHNDLMAVGVLHALAQLGRGVPNDVAVVGCDDIPVAEYTIPALSTIALPFAETGAGAVRLLLERIDGSTDQHERRMLPSTLRCRQSCGCAPTIALGPDAVAAGE